MLSISRRAGLVVVSAVLAFTGVNLASHSEAATPDERPTCEGVKLENGKYRLFLEPGDVVSGDVVSVRSSSSWWRQRPDGTWMSTQSPRTGRWFHVVIKSEADLFSERRWSSWVYCGPVKV